MHKNLSMHTVDKKFYETKLSCMHSLLGLSIHIMLLMQIAYACYWILSKHVVKTLQFLLGINS